MPINESLIAEDLITTYEKKREEERVSDTRSVAEVFGANRQTEPH